MRVNLSNSYCMCHNNNQPSVLQEINDTMQIPRRIPSSVFSKIYILKDACAFLPSFFIEWPKESLKNHFGIQINFPKKAAKQAALFKLSKMELGQMSVQYIMNSFKLQAQNGKRISFAGTRVQNRCTMDLIDVPHVSSCYTIQKQWIWSLRC